MAKTLQALGGLACLKKHPKHLSKISNAYWNSPAGRRRKKAMSKGRSK